MVIPAVRFIYTISYTDSRHKMNKIQRIEFVKAQIDEARSEGLNNVANFWCDELAKEEASA